MPYLEHHKRLHRLPPGETILGKGDGCAIHLQEVPHGRLAAIRVDEKETWLRPLARELPIRVNDEAVTKGRALAHGDLIRIGKAEILYIDESQVGGTATAESAAAVQAIVEAAADARDAGYADAGGTLTRKRDRARIAVGAPRFRIGREAGCDLVVPESTVSRLHAEIRYQGGKYVLHDLSTNGCKVNGVRAARTHVLSTGDVITIGGHDYEFTCEKVPLTPAEIARMEGTVTPAVVDVSPQRVARQRGGLALFLFLLVAAGAAIAWLLSR
jgi:pSer/pThr/pTyr-binding forkhead associated (FHA) protein